MAISSPVDICNLALDHLNVKPIVSIETPSNSTEELCARWYDQSRREALRRYPWNFAAKRIILAPDATDPVFGYSKQFTLPADFIRMKYINQSVLVRDNPIPASSYTIEDNKILIGEGSVINTDQLRLIYISDFETVTRMEPAFISLLAITLAQNMSYKLSQSNGNVERLNALMEQAETKARAINGQDNPPRRVERSRNRGFRRGGSGVKNYDGIIVFE